MREKTDLKEVKNIAITFVYLKPTALPEIPIFIQHPYFESAFQNINDEFFNIFEDTEKYRELQQSVVNKIESQDTVLKIFIMLRRQYRLVFFDFVKEYLGKKDYAEMLIFSWTDAEQPMRDVNVKPRTILKFFKQAEKQYLMCEEDYEIYKNLPEQVTIYRGVGSAEYKNGYSWTLSQEKAEWFSTRFAENGIVYQATANKSDVLCFNNDRAEQEIIIDYKKVNNIVKLKETS